MEYIYALLAVLVLNLVGFLVAYSIKSDKLTDFSYGTSFFVIALYSFLTGSQSWFSVILLILVSLWAFRLAFFLVIRIFKINRDKRFDGIRESFVKFGSFWLMQAIVAWVVMLPAIYFFVNSNNKFHWLILIGLAIWLKGFVVETVADLQKFKFNNNPKNKGQWISSGFWGISRHPNYYGEILIWVGIYVFTFTTLSTQFKLIGLISPALIYVLLRYVTGIPKLERAADKKWGNDKAYQKYKQKVPLLLPIPKR
jgi:steroid 5-alpha reductase family enzyme